MSLRHPVVVTLFIVAALTTQLSHASIIGAVAAGATGAVVGNALRSHGERSNVQQANQQAVQPAMQTTTASQIEVGFSPEGSAEALVLKSINVATRSILLTGYSFTSPTVVSALVAAKKRGVDVRVVVDYKNNIAEDSRGNAKAALNTLVNAGILVRTIDVFPINHDKVMVIDRAHVQTGSFNYSTAAATKNSENVIVIWNNPAVAEAYVAHWIDRFNRGRDYQPGY